MTRQTEYRPCPALTKVITIVLLMTAVGLPVGRAQGTFRLQAELLPPSPLRGSAAGSAVVTVETYREFAIVTWNVGWTGLTALPVNARVRTGESPVAPGFALGRFFSNSTPGTGAYAGFREVRDYRLTAVLIDGGATLEIYSGLADTPVLSGLLRPVPEPGTFWCTIVGAAVAALRAHGARGALSRFSCCCGAPPRRAGPLRHVA